MLRPSLFFVLFLCGLSLALGGCLKQELYTPSTPVQRLNAAYIEKAEALAQSGDLRKARSYLQLAVEMNPNDQEALRKKRELDSRIEALTKKETAQAEASLAEGRREGALKHYLRVLALAPENQQAIAFLRSYNENMQSIHVVKPGETLADVAEKKYGDPGAAAVVAGFNRLKAGASLAEGTMLTLPSLDDLKRQAPGDDVVPATVLPEVAQEGATADGGEGEESLTASIDPKAGEDSGMHDPAAAIARPVDELLNEAEACLLQKHYGTALANVEKVLKKYKDDPRALDMRNASYYALGKEYYEKDLYQEAFEAFSEADSNYRDVSEKVEELRHSLSEQHYTQGVKFFVEEQLELALEEWNKALQYDPEHPQAAKDIDKVKQLQEKLGTME
jgi:tetratricopeptide (TPR) repeat protein